MVMEEQLFMEVEDGVPFLCCVVLSFIPKVFVGLDHVL